MASRDKVKFIQEVPATDAMVAARRPFEVRSENRRRFVRIEISSPMTLRKIRDTNGRLWPEGEWHVINGSILNISDGGVLVEVDQQLLETELVSLHFIMQDVEPLSDVLGQVMRSDQDDDGFLVGIKFITLQSLSDRLTQAELDLLPKSLTEFQSCIKGALEKYVCTEELSAR
jgi:hypothetical protein